MPPGVKQQEGAHLWLVFLWEPHQPAYRHPLRELPQKAKNDIKIKFQYEIIHFFLSSYTHCMSIFNTCSCNLSS